MAGKMENSRIMEPRGIYYYVFPLPASTQTPDKDSKPTDAEDASKGKFWKFYDSTAGKIIVGSTIAVGTAAAAIPIGLFALGFGSAGVVAGSIAAGMQGPSVAAGSLFAICQSLGATGATTGLLGGLLTPLLAVPKLFGGNLYKISGDGRHLLASTDIEPGTIIFEETAILPKETSVKHFVSKDSSKILVEQQLDKINGCKIFSSTDSEKNEGGQSKVNYHLGAKLEHSCSPNCIWQIGKGPDFNLRVRATVPIKKGEILTISPLQNHNVFTRGTIDRRRFILENLHYFCKCPRCNDPTELESFSSAIKCPVCPYPDSKTASSEKSGKFDPGYLLPRYHPAHGSNDFTFLNLAPEKLTFWRCTRCNAKEIPLDELYGDIANIAQQLDLHDPASPQFDPIKAEEFYRQVVQEEFLHLHPNHWLVMEAKFRLVFVILLRKFLEMSPKSSQSLPIGDKSQEASEQTLTSDQIKDYIAMCQHLLGVQEKTNPGLSGYRAQIIHCLSLSIPCKLKIPVESPQENLELVGQYVKLMREAFSCYHRNFLSGDDQIQHSQVLAYYQKLVKEIDQVSTALASKTSKI